MKIIATHGCYLSDNVFGFGGSALLESAEIKEMMNLQINHFVKLMFKVQYNPQPWTNFVGKCTKR